jgi:hypothetical protein
MVMIHNSRNYTEQSLLEKNMIKKENHFYHFIQILIFEVIFLGKKISDNYSKDLPHIYFKILYIQKIFPCKDTTYT